MNQYTFQCEGKDRYDYSVSYVQEYIHSTEEEARRNVIDVMNVIYGVYPRKITLLKCERKWMQDPLSFD